MPYSGLSEVYNVFKEGRDVGVQLAHRFTVDFIGLDNLEVFKKKDVKDIFPIYVKKVKFPMYSFKKETFQMGPFDRVFPTLDNNGMELTIEFIEDYQGFISGLISSLQNNNFRDGRHFIRNTFGISINTYNANGYGVTNYTYKNCYYLKSEPISLDYEAVDKLTYSVTFLCNRYSIEIQDSFIGKNAKQLEVIGSKPSEGVSVFGGNS